jgi:hypothetical protein
MDFENNQQNRQDQRRVEALGKSDFQVLPCSSRKNAPKIGYFSYLFYSFRQVTRVFTWLYGIFLSQEFYGSCRPLDLVSPSKNNNGG